MSSRNAVLVHNKAQIAEYNPKLARYRATLDAGTDPTTGRRDTAPRQALTESRISLTNRIPSGVSEPELVRVSIASRV
jgi:hypothetical protein